MSKVKTILKIAAPMLVIAIITGMFIYKSETKKKSENTDLQYPLEITEINIDDLRSHGMPLILDFGSDTCPPCREMHPVLVTLNEEFQGKALLHYINLSYPVEGASQFPLQYTPTQFFFNADGTPFVPSKELSEVLYFNYYSDKESGSLVYTAHIGALSESELRAILSEMGVE